MASSQDAALQLPLRPVRNYTDISGSGSARLHLGDSYVINQSGFSHLTDDQAAGRLEFTNHYSSAALRPVASYVARPDLQAQMKERLHDTIEQRGRSSRILVLCGLGGAGKSQLTLSYIQRYREDYTAVFWIDAGAKTRLEADYRQIRNLLHSSKRTDAELDLNTCVAEVKQWCHHKNGRWLFVFDSADDIDNPETPGYIDLQRVVIDTPSADIVITTRSQSAKDMTDLDAVQAAELTPSEARDLFLRRSKIPATSEDVYTEVDQIVDELGFFALAVNLAASCVAETPRFRKSPSNYLNEYRRRRKILLDRQPKAHVDQYGASMLATWETSHAAMADRCPEACNLLAFLAFLGPDDLFSDIFHNENEELIKRHARVLSAGLPSASGPGALDTAFEVLTFYSLVLWRNEHEGYAMHRLVHAWSYERLDIASQGSFCNFALRFLCLYAWSLIKEPALLARIVPHVISCFSRVREMYGKSDAIDAVLLKRLPSLATILLNAGQDNPSFEIWSFLHDHYRQHSRTDRYYYYWTVGGLGSLMDRQGRTKEAIELLRPVLAECRRSHGPNYAPAREMAISLSHLLQVHKPAEAEELLRWTLSEPETRDGAQDRSSFEVMGHLASLLVLRGRMVEAKELGRQALCGLQNFRGPMHPLTLWAKTSLGKALTNSGKHGEAHLLLRQAFMDYEVTMGSHHPSTLFCIVHCGVSCHDLGKLTEGIELFRRALSGYEKVLDIHHPSTLLCVWNLAHSLRKQKSYSEALDLYQRAADGYAASLGSDHRKTRGCSEELADLRSFLEGRVALLETSRQASRQITERL